MRRFAGVTAVLAVLLGGCTSGTQVPGTSEGSVSHPATGASSQQPETSSPTTSVEERTSLPLVVVLDASGSMKHDDAGAGVTRIEAAQQAVGGIFSTLTAGTRTALIGYGTTMHGDEVTAEQGCADVEVLSPLGPVDAAALRTTVDAVRAGGWTPIGPALKEAAAQLDGEPGRVVLVSDGRNTCEAEPPCEVARKLKDQNPGLTISVVSLRTDQDDVRCVADATGGYYTTADTGKQLEVRAKAALDEARAKLSLSPSGVDGIAVGASHAGIRAEVPGFPGLETGTSRQWNGQSVTVVVWLDCEWFFEDGSLVAIGTVENSDGRTVDGIAPGQRISEAEDFLGQPIAQLTEDDSRVRVYPANQTGLHWRVVTGTDDVIRRIVLCRCAPTPDALVLSFEGLGQWKISDRTLIPDGKLVPEAEMCQGWLVAPGYEEAGFSFQRLNFDSDKPDSGTAFEIWVGDPWNSDKKSPVVTYAGAKIGMTFGEVKKLHPDLRFERKKLVDGFAEIALVRSGERELLFLTENTGSTSDTEVVHQMVVRDWGPEVVGGC